MIRYNFVYMYKVLNFIGNFLNDKDFFKIFFEKNICYKKFFYWKICRDFVKFRFYVWVIIGEVFRIIILLIGVFVY